jgi:hypothetical protein
MPETIATTTTPKASENIKLNPPKPFTGKRSDFILFVQDVFVYLKVNKSIYDNNFLHPVLSGRWRRCCMETAIYSDKDWRKCRCEDRRAKLGKLQEFIEALKKTFQPYDEPAEALEDMKKLRLGDGSITEHNSKF